jgi:hypothetical protein
MTERELLIEKLSSIIYHKECEDSWYSCPLSEEGCSNDKMTGCCCDAEETRVKLADFILADRRRITMPLRAIGQLKHQPLPSYEILCQSIEETLKLGGEL